MNLIYLDLETTGLELTSSIVQFAAYKLDETREINANSKLISEYCNPFDNEQMELFKEHKLEESLIASLNVSNITFDILDKAKSEYEVFNEFMIKLDKLYTESLLSNERIVLVGYNIINYDYNILINAVKRLYKEDIELQSKYLNILFNCDICDIYVDTMKYFHTKSFDKQPYDYKLSTISRLFQFQSDSFHNAETDVLATIHISKHIDKMNMYNVKKFTNDILLTFGKCKYQLLSQVKQTDSGYYQWLMTNCPEIKNRVELINL